MAYVLSSVSGNLISAASAGFAPTNSADVSAIASAYQVVSATATQLNAGTAYVTSINETPISAARAGNAANAALATSAWYDGTGRLISALPDEATVSSIASAYAESAASSKQDTLSFGYDDDKISAINGSALAGQGGGMITSIESSLDPWYQTAISGLNGSSLYASWALSAADAGMAYHATTATSAGYAESAGAAPTAWASSFITGVESPSGTIRVLGGTAVEATNSALLPSTVTAGFTSVGGTTESTNTTSFTLPVSNPNTHVHFSGGWSDGTFAVNTDNGIYTSEPSYGYIDVEFDLPYATSVTATYNWVSELSYTASASAHEEGGGVGELAWATALPTYQYDAENKISSINGSAIGGAGSIDSATCSAIASAYAESAASSKLDTTAFNSADFYSTSNPSGFIDSAYVDSAVSSKADSSALSSYALSADVSGTVDLVSTQSANWGGSALALSAGPGVKLEKVGDTLVASTDETVLFSGSNSGMVATPLTEPLSGFDSFKICFNPFTSNGMSREWKEFSWAGSSDVYTVATFYRAQNDNLAWYVAFQPNSDGTTITPITNKLNTLGTSAVQDRTQIHVCKVVGINRTAGV